MFRWIVSTLTFFAIWICEGLQMGQSQPSREGICYQKLLSAAIGKGQVTYPQQVYLFRKDKVTVEVRDDSLGRFDIRHNKKVVIEFEGCPVFVGYSNSVDFASDMATNYIQRSIDSIEDRYLVIDVTDLYTAKKVTGLTRLILDRTARIRGADEFIGDWQKSLSKAHQIRTSGM